MEIRILRLPSVMSITGRSRSAIYDDVSRGLFPTPVRLGLRAIGWRADEVDAWIEARVRARQSQQANNAR